jgi:hypothetical protein
VPPEPLAETAALTNLSLTTWWSAQPKPQQLASIQLFDNLIAQIGRHITQVQDEEVRLALNVVVERAAKAAQAASIIDFGTNNPVQIGLNQLADTKLRTPPEQVAAEAAKAHGTLKGSYPGLADPPAVAATNPAPTTARSGGAGGAGGATAGSGAAAPGAGAR